jgi:hypothetical protein
MAHFLPAQRWPNTSEGKGAPEPYAASESRPWWRRLFAVWPIVRARSFPSFASLPPAPATAVAKLWARSKSRTSPAVLIVGTTHAHPPPRIYIRLRQMLTGPAPHRNNRKNLKTQDGRKLRRHRGAGRSSGSSPGFTTSGAWWSATSGWWRTISAWCASGAS